MGAGGLGPTDLYHVGIVAPDLDAGISRMTELLGIRWGPIFETDLDTRFADGEVRSVAMRVSYSIDHPHLEMIQEVPGTTWVCNAHSNLHHIGLWTDELAATSEALSAAGCPLEAAGASEGGEWPRTFAFHRDEVLGVRIEAADAGIREIMQTIWAEAREEGR